MAVPREAGIVTATKQPVSDVRERIGAGKGARRTLTGANAVLAYLASLKVLVYLSTAGNYGYFRDELYYIAASERLGLGYVDFPPFMAYLTAFVRWALGDSPLALHLLPTLAGALVVVLAGLMARELGGGRFAQGTAALAVLVAPTFLAMGTWLSVDAFDQLFWASAAYVLILTLGRDRPRLWLLFGLIAGFGLITKDTMLFLGFAVFVALLLTAARGHLRTRWPWLGGAISFSFLLPYLYWQVENGWPTLSFWQNYGEKVVPDSIAGFLAEQILSMHPATLPLWLAGLCHLLFAKEGRPYRVLGWVYVVLFVLFVVLNAKFYYFAPAYPMLFAAGGVAIERFVERRSRWGSLKPAYVVFLIITGAMVAPLTAVPALPVDALAKIFNAGGYLGIESETREKPEIPQTFADRFGWESMVATVAGVRDRLPPEERAKSCVLAGNFGEAGALDLYGPRYGLPGAISGHNSYYLWGTGGCTGEVVISVGVPLGRLEAVFGDVQKAAATSCEYCMPDEDGLPVYVSRDPKLPFQEAWPLFKRYE